MTKEELKLRRLAIGETQAVFAARFGVDRTTYVSWETVSLPRRASGLELIRRVLVDVDAELEKRASVLAELVKEKIEEQMARLEK